MINVLIADDHPVVRAGLQALIDTADGAQDIRVVASLGDAAASVDKVTELRGTPDEVDVVLMDLRFGDSPGRGEAQGVQAIRAIRALPKPPRVLVVTNYSTDHEVVGAASAGAVGYLLKDSPAKQLLDGIRAANRGESVMASEVMGTLMGQMTNPVGALTNREAEVLELVGQGKSNREIAKQLVLTEATVKSHLTHIFTKLNVNNRTSAVATARRRGIIQ